METGQAIKFYNFYLRLRSSVCACVVASATPLEGWSEEIPLRRSNSNADDEEDGREGIRAIKSTRSRRKARNDEGETGKSKIMKWFSSGWKERRRRRRNTNRSNCIPNRKWDWLWQWLVTFSFRVSIFLVNKKTENALNDRRITKSDLSVDTISCISVAPVPFAAPKSPLDYLTRCGRRRCERTACCVPFCRINLRIGIEFSAFRGRNERATNPLFIIIGLVEQIRNTAFDCKSWEQNASEFFLIHNSLLSDHFRTSVFSLGSPALSRSRRTIRRPVRGTRFLRPFVVNWEKFVNDFLGEVLGRGVSRFPDNHWSFKMGRTLTMTWCAVWRFGYFKLKWKQINK